VTAVVERAIGSVVAVVGVVVVVLILGWGSSKRGK
jgi:hypothetical protein